MINKNDDMFPHTDKTAKWRLISFRIPRGGLDVLPVLSCHTETIALLQKSNRKLQPDTYVKFSLDMEDYYRIKGEEKIE